MSPPTLKEPIVPTFAFSTDRATDLAVDVLVLPVFEGPEAAPRLQDVKGLALLGQFTATGAKGKSGESLLVPTTGEAPAAKAVLLIGVGPKDAVTPDACRRAIGRVARQLARRKTVATTLPQIVRAKDQLEAVQATVEGVLLGSYRFDRYKSKADDADQRLGKVTLLGAGKADAKSAKGAKGAKGAIRRGEVIAESQMWARDLVNTPALDLPPAELAKEAQARAKQVGITCKVWTEAELKKGGF